MHRTPLSPLRAALLFGLAALTIVGCDDDDDDGGGPSDNLVLAKATPSGDAQTGPVSVALPDPLRVLVTEDGIPVEGVDVTFAATDGSVDPTIDATDADGIASTVWTLGATAGAQAASAAVSGASGSPLGFTATATGGAAGGIVKVSGDLEAGIAGQPMANPMVIMITDDLGDPVEASPVDFAVASGDATVAPTATTTNAAGQAQTVVTLGPAVGPVSVTATAAGVAGSPVTFALESGHVVVSNDEFTPETITVPVGTEVRWVWQVGAVGHNITPVAPSTEPTATPNPLNSAPFVYTHTFTTPGTYNYECTQHPTTMQGTITVTP